MPQLKTLPATADTEEIVETVKRDGAVILKDVIAPADLEALRAELMPYIEATPNGQDGFTGFHTTRTGALVARSPQARKLVTMPSVVAAARAFLEPYCERIQLHLTQVIRIRPGQEAQAIHRDRWAWGAYLQGLEPQFNTIWALTDFTKENGATQVVPGSVDWSDERRPTDDDITWAEMSAGSVILYSGSVFHGGGANISNGDRIGINITYALGWLRQEENQYLSCPPEIAKTLEPELQDLIGYAMGSYALGYYTPPVGPGEGPEVIGPAYALGRKASEIGFGDSDLLEATAAQVGGVENV